MSREPDRAARCLPGLAGAGVLSAGPGYRFGGWGLGPGFTLLRWGAQLGALAAFLAVASLLVKDDDVVRVRARGAGSRVDGRSLSRIGVGDLGVNAARVRAFSAQDAGDGAAWGLTLRDAVV